MRVKTRTMELLDARPEVFDVVLSRVVEGEGSPMEICRELGLSWGAVLGWASMDAGRVEKVMGMRVMRSHRMTEEAIEIADGAEDVGKARLQVDTRLKVAGRLNPEDYGDAVRGGVGEVKVEIVQFFPPGVETLKGRILEGTVNEPQMIADTTRIPGEIGGDGGK